MQRPWLDAHQLGVGVVAAHLVVDADDFARRAVEVGELFVFAAGIAEMHQPRCLDAVAVLVGDRADVIERARRSRRALQPFRGILRKCRRTGEQRRGEQPRAQQLRVRPATRDAGAKTTGAHPDRWRQPHEIRPHTLDGGGRRILLMHQQIFVVDRPPRVGGAHRRRLACGGDRRRVGGEGIVESATQPDDADRRHGRRDRQRHRRGRGLAGLRRKHSRLGRELFREARRESGCRCSRTAQCVADHVVAHPRRDAAGIRATRRRRHRRCCASSSPSISSEISSGFGSITISDPFPSPTAAAARPRSLRAPGISGSAPCQSDNSSRWQSLRNSGPRFRAG